MNKRIKELAEKAGSTHKQSLGVYQFYTDELEKFVELIVMECIKESMEEIVYDDEIAKETDPLIQEYLKGSNQGVVDAVVRFRNHFGVQE